MFRRFTTWLRWQRALFLAPYLRRWSAFRRGLSLDAAIFASNPTWRQVLGLAKETTWGTPVVATTFFPVAKPSSFVPDFEDIMDDGERNNASFDQAYYQGVGLTQFDTGEMLVWPDDSLHWLMGLFGVDTISGAGPYTHPLTLFNTGFPPSYTLTLYDNLIATARRISGAMVNEVTLKWSVKGKLTMQAKGIGKIADTVAKPTEVFSAAAAYLGWQFAANIGGANTKIEEGELTLKRQVDAVYGAAGTQDMNDRSIDTLSVTGRYTFAAADDTEKALYTGNTQPSSLLTWTSGANSLAIQMTKTAFGKGGTIDRSNKYSRTVLPFRAIANATDAGTGNGPAKITGINTKAVAY
jgi:hypothetical protein